MGKETNRLPEEVNNALVLAANGAPYLLIVNEDGVGVHRVVKDGFDCDWLFDYIKDLAREEKGFRTALADYIIELSQEI